MFASLLVCELLIILTPSPLPVNTRVFLTNLTSTSNHGTFLHTIFPHRVTFQHVKFLHQVFMFLSIALNRVAPKIFPGEPKVPAGVIDRIRNLAALADREGDPIFCFPIYDLLTTTHFYFILFI